VIAIIAALRLIIGAKDSHPLTLTDKRVISLFFIMLMIPSAMTSWSTLACFSLWCIWKYRHNPRVCAGFSILLAVGIREPVVMILLKSLAPVVLTLDAVFAQTFADFMGLSSQRHDNLITTEQGRSILILAGCSSVSNLSLIWLGWLVVARNLSYQWKKRDAIALTTLTLMVLILNWLRLAVLTLSQEAYHWLHGETGLMVYQTILLILMFLIIRRIYAKEIMDYYRPTRQHHAVG